MTAAKTPTRPRALPIPAAKRMTELRRITAQVRKLEALHDRRAELFVELAELGVTQREIAAAADVTPVAVCKAIGKRKG